MNKKEKNIKKRSDVNTGVKENARRREKTTTDGTKKNDGNDLEMVSMADIGKRKKRKKTAFDYVRYGIMAAAIVVFVVAGYNLYSIFSEYSKGEETYDNVADNFTKSTENSDGPVEVTGDVVTAFEKLNVDFASLQQANTDVKGWIQFEGLDISYPLLQHPSDNNYYLTKMWDKNENTAGSIFMDIFNTDDMSDYNTFIYGHNMKNLSMFGSLKEYKDQANYAGKEYFWIYTPKANYRYQIFSVHEVKVTSNFFKTFLTNGEEYSQYVAEAKKDSRYDTGVEVTGEDKIVTLSTCTASGKDWRLLVQAKLIGVETLVADEPEQSEELMEEGY